jgi:hypothetical protein
VQGDLIAQPQWEELGSPEYGIKGQHKAGTFCWRVFVRKLLKDLLARVPLGELDSGGTALQISYLTIRPSV